MDSEFFEYLTAGTSEPRVSLSGDMSMSNTGVVEPEWVSVPEVCRDDLLHLYVNEIGELENGKESVGEMQPGTYIVENELKSEPGQDECEQDEECTYLELKTVPVEAYSQVMYGGADGYPYVKTGQNCLESYKDEFGFYVSSLPDHSKETGVQLPEETMLESDAEQWCSVESDNCFELETRHSECSEVLGESCEVIESKADSVSLMKLRLHRIISNSEKSTRQTTSNSEERLNDSKVAPNRAMNIRVDMPVHKVSCPMVSQIAATILDRWKSMRPLGVTGLGDLPKYTTSSMKAKLVNRPGSTSNVVKKAAGDKSQVKTSRASRALERRRESQLALQQLQQMSKPVFKRRSRPSGAQGMTT